MPLQETAAAIETEEEALARKTQLFVASLMKLTPQDLALTLERFRKVRAGAVPPLGEHKLCANSLQSEETRDSIIKKPPMVRKDSYCSQRKQLGSRKRDLKLMRKASTWSEVTLSQQLPQLRLG